MSAAEIGEFIDNLGEAYLPAGKKFKSNGINGEMLVARCTEEQVTALLTELQITNKIHVERIVMEIEKLRAADRGAMTKKNEILKKLEEERRVAEIARKKREAEEAALAKEAEKLPAPGSSIVVGDEVTVTPKKLMEQLFRLQGIAYNPENGVDSNGLSRITDTIKKSKAASPYKNKKCDGVTSFDCFINYRVAADKTVALKVYEHLRKEGLQPFLDVKCLVDGLPWKEGFIKGLRGSLVFVALISKAGLAKARDHTADHRWDNVLLEYETALQIAKSTGNSWYICPVLVGSSAKYPFTDFNLAHYPDSLTRVSFEGTCKWNAVKFHDRGYNGHTWNCCKKAGQRALGCCTRNLEKEEKKEIQEGIIRYHKSWYERPLFGKTAWKCCREGSKFARACEVEKLTGDEYHLFFQEEWKQFPNAAYGYDSDYKPTLPLPP